MYFVQVDKLCVWTIYDEVEAKGFQQNFFRKQDAHLAFLHFL